LLAFKKVAQDSMGCLLLFLSPSFFKGKEGYDQVAGCLSDGECGIFTHNEKEIKEFIVKLLEARVEHLDQHCGIYLSTLELSMVQ
jgi:hypothetical protein